MGKAILVTIAVSLLFGFGCCAIIDNLIRIELKYKVGDVLCSGEFNSAVIDTYNRGYLLRNICGDLVRIPESTITKCREN